MVTSEAHDIYEASGNAGIFRINLHRAYLCPILTGITRTVDNRERDQLSSRRRATLVARQAVTMAGAAGHCRFAVFRAFSLGTEELTDAARDLYLADSLCDDFRTGFLRRWHVGMHRSNSRADAEIRTTGDD